MQDQKWSDTMLRTAVVLMDMGACGGGSVSVSGVLQRAGTRGLLEQVFVRLVSPTNKGCEGWWVQTRVTDLWVYSLYNTVQFIPEACQVRESE